MGESPDGAVHRSRQIVRFGDIDHAGIVYYPRFLHYFHVAMEELFSDALGMDYARLLDEERFGLPAVHLEVDFHRPLRYGDHIWVTARVEALGETSVTWRYRVEREGEEGTVAEGTVVTVGLDLDAFRKRPLPGWLRRALTGKAGEVPEEPGPDLTPGS